jgi:ABC-type Co2+ transport system permease subunit
MDENMIPLFGVLAAGMFVLKTINIPIPMSPVSWHMVGAELTAIIFASPSRSNCYCRTLLMIMF